jgi:peptidoglycan/LPS O-acetylase OafA/YrhL
MLPVPRNHQHPARSHGLDTLRALAIVLVFFYHYMVFVSRDNTFGFLSDVGWVGVDLFFALSGYLIGNQIFAAMRSEAGLSLPRFYARRLLRTLPNYLVVLALFALWPWFRAGSELPPLWKFLTFTQNLGLRPGTAFSHAWSLCIEEQFYLLLPALALGIAALRRSLVLAWVAVAAGLALGIGARAWLWLHHVGGNPEGGLNFMRLIYYSSLCRGDELIAGVAVALLRNYHPGVWQRLTARGPALLVAGVAVTALAFFLLVPFEQQRGFALTVAGFPLLATGFALLIVAAVSERSLLRTVRVPGAASLAAWSYAIYLTHKSVCVLMGRYLDSRGIGAGSATGAVVNIVLSLLAGWLLYRAVERPFLALRDRWAPSNLKDAAVPVQRFLSTTQPIE